MPEIKRSKSNRWMRAGVYAALIFAILLSAGAFRFGVAAMGPPQVQAVQSKSMPQTPSPMDEISVVPDTAKDRMEAQRDRMWNDERRKKLISDTDKLLQLATDLKTEVDKSSRNELSVKVIQKAAEIEKLSHDVKERMKN